MTDYQMPVLTEQEIRFISAYNSSIINSLGCRNKLTIQQEAELITAKIALAALTAEPVDPEDCFQRVYLAPPVLVIKQEG